MVKRVHSTKIMTDDDGSVIAENPVPTCKDAARRFKIVTDDRFSRIPAYTRVRMRGRIRARTMTGNAGESVIRHRGRK